MALKGLIQRELCEGLTEEELADLVKVPRETVANILSDTLPHDPAIWEKWARYFRMEMDFLRTGDHLGINLSTKQEGNNYPSAAGHIRTLPFLTWDRLEDLATSKERPWILQGDSMIETTDIAGTPTFAVKVPDDSMIPLFGRDELMFVNPDLKWDSGDYVLLRHDNGQSKAILRRIELIDNQAWLRPLNPKYHDLLLSSPDAVLGKVVRLRKNLT